MTGTIALKLRPSRDADTVFSVIAEHAGAEVYVGAISEHPGVTPPVIGHIKNRRKHEGL